MGLRLRRSWSWRVRGGEMGTGMWRGWGMRWIGRLGGVRWASLKRACFTMMSWLIDAMPGQQPVVLMRVLLSPEQIERRQPSGKQRAMCPCHLESVPPPPPASPRYLTEAADNPSSLAIRHGVDCSWRTVTPTPSIVQGPLTRDQQLLGRPLRSDMRNGLVISS